MNYKTGKCGLCNNKASYSQKYDVYYCTNCNKCIEEKCSDKTCEFCINRPDDVKELL